MADERGIWRFRGSLIAKLASAGFVITESVALDTANGMTVAGWPSALLDETADADVKETTPDWAQRLIGELRERRFDADALDRETPVTEVDAWTAFWRAVENSAIPAMQMKLLQLEHEIHEQRGPRPRKEPPALVGPAEFADMCRVEEMDVICWFEAGELPKPYRILSDMPCWLQADAEEWARQSGRLKD